MTRNAIGFVLIDAPHSALNNAGQDAGARTENAVVVKTIRKGREIYPYVSGQAWRYWWRMILAEKFGWELSPILREAKVAFTAANPFTYPDDDVFGYMRALRKNEGGTLTRLSPLKCSPLISVFPNAPTDDFGVMARHGGDPVPYEHQFYSTVLKGIFSLDLSNLGRFHEIEKTGYKNLDEAYVQKEEIKKAISSSGASKKNGQYTLPLEKRRTRAKETIAALPFLYSTTKSAGHLTDVTPKFIILCVIEGGNHLFMNVTNSEPGKNLVNVATLRQVILDYQGIILSDIFIGRQEGFLDEINAELDSLVNELANTKNVHLVSPKQAVEQFVEQLPNFIE